MNPSYFKIINRFWDEAPELDGYKTDHSALFFALVDSINRNGWKDTEIEYDRIINKVRLGKKNYLDGRKWLEANRFITFRPGKGDYAKAKFGLGVAVLGRTASDTAEDSLPESDAVLPKTACDTALSTAGDTAPGTASDTYLIEEPITSNLLLLTSQQQPAVAAEKKEEGIDSGDQKKEAHPTPNPLPSADDVRVYLMASSAHYRHAVERLKIVKNETEYLDFIEQFIEQQLMKAKEGSPVFPEIHRVKEHFMHWLNKRPLINQQANGTAQNAKPVNEFGQGAIIPSGGTYKRQSFGRRDPTGNGVSG